MKQQGSSIRSGRNGVPPLCRCLCIYIFSVGFRLAITLFTHIGELFKKLVCVLLPNLLGAKSILPDQGHQSGCDLPAFAQLLNFCSLIWSLEKVLENLYGGDDLQRENGVGKALYTLSHECIALAKLGDSVYVPFQNLTSSFILSNASAPSSRASLRISSSASLSSSLAVRTVFILMVPISVLRLAKKSLSSLFLYRAISYSISPASVSKKYSTRSSKDFPGACLRQKETESAQSGNHQKQWDWEYSRRVAL